jgi:hypothetical protein
MAEIDTGFPLVRIETILDAATDFGLTRDEASEAVDVALQRVAGEAMPDCLNELTAALARSILEKQRQIVASQRLL